MPAKLLGSSLCIHEGAPTAPNQTAPQLVVADVELAKGGYVGTKLIRQRCELVVADVELVQWQQGQLLRQTRELAVAGNEHAEPSERGHGGGEARQWVVAVRCAYTEKGYAWIVRT